MKTFEVSNELPESEQEEGLVVKEALLLSLESCFESAARLLLLRENAFLLVPSSAGHAVCTKVSPLTPSRHFPFVSQ